MIELAALPGDGVGAEVLDGPVQLLRALESTGRVRVTGPWPVGQSAWAEHGTVVPADTVRACEAADAMLLGAIGEHPGAAPEAARAPSALLHLRAHFDLRVSIREVVRGALPPLVVVRNLLAGAYADDSLRTEGGPDTPARDVIELSFERIAELTELACDLVAHHPGHELVSADKANLFATSRLWRSVVGEVAARRDVPVRHVYVDRIAFELARDLPSAVVLTEGIFGDIVSDVAASRAGSIALSSSASVRPGAPAAGRCVGLFEPTHGSAPHHTGRGTANPIGAYLGLAGALDWFDETRALAGVVRGAVGAVLERGALTADLCAPNRTPVSTAALAAAVNAEAEQRLAADQEVRT